MRNYEDLRSIVQQTFFLSDELQKDKAKWQKELNRICVESGWTVQDFEAEIRRRIRLSA